MGELKVGNSVVPLEASPEYKADPATLQAAARFKPLADWASRMKVPEGVAVKALEVQQVAMMVGRVTSVRFSVLVEAENGEQHRESVSVCDSPHAALLVLVDVEGATHVVTVAGPLPCIATDQLHDIPFGASGAALEVPYGELLEQIGATTTTAKHRPLHVKDGQQLLYPGAGGAQAHRYYELKLPDQAASFKEQFPVRDGDYVLDLVPLEGLERETASTRTLTALALHHSMAAAA